MADARRTGRPSKGARAHLSAKIPLVLNAAIDAEADRRGLDRTSIVVEALAQKFGLTLPFDVQETLPLNPAA